MQEFKIKKGLNLPLAGTPLQEVSDAPVVKHVALLGPDYEGLKPSLAVDVGDHVKTGQVLFTDSKLPAVKFTSPGCGVVKEINRGEKRRFLSIIIQLEGNETEEFHKYSETELETLTRQQVVENLTSSGLWTALRKRPFGKIPSPEKTARALFITAMDTNPLAPSAEIVISMYREAFIAGLKVLSRLGISAIYVCRRPQDHSIPGEDCVPGVETVTFSGPHPAGLPGTHIHFLAPASQKHSAWHIGYQDVIAVGQLFLTGKLDTTRIISLAGPRVKNPRLLRTRLGASISELISGETEKEDNRVISGSVLSGHTAEGPLNYLGRYHQQISILEEGDKRHFFGWVMPGFSKFAFKWVNISSLFFWKKYNMTTNIHGGHRAIMPIGSYEEVMPLDILPTYLLRALEIGDLEESEALGALELIEEDLALCTFVDPGKNDFGEMLRKVLTTIEKEG
ncbi:MAG: Na(+)-translocating NADH-quinone reductase subunit A [Planctomycetia bacterium]|nr:Na(+)-translocating NADH-quinone reductase subunit A [Planctomycetia bacterium]